MFGYVITNKPELKIREFARYKGIYCGLCQSLKEKYGRTGQMTLTYDMTFLVLLLSSLYEPSEETKQKRCLVHPAKKQWMIRNEITEYAADMNILLSYYHFLDDWEDEKSVSGLAGKTAFHRRAEKIRKKYPEKAEVIQTQLEELANLEKQQVTEPDAISRPFGTLMAELFCYKKIPLRIRSAGLAFSWENTYIFWMRLWILKKIGKREVLILFLNRKKGRIFPKMYWIYWKERCAQLSWNLKNYHWNRM